MGAPSTTMNPEPAVDRRALDEPAPAERLTVVPSLEPEGPVEAASIQVLLFETAGQHFALPVTGVQEVQRLVSFAGGGFEGPIIGMIDVRGTVGVAVDVSVLLGFGAAALTLDSQMVIVDGDTEPVALVVDHVDDVVALPEGALKPAPSRHALKSFALGVIRLHDGLVIVLNPKVLLGAIETRRGAVVGKNRGAREGGAR